MKMGIETLVQGSVNWVGVMGRDLVATLEKREVGSVVKEMFGDVIYGVLSESKRVSFTTYIKWCAYVNGKVSEWDRSGDPMERALSFVLEDVAFQCGEIWVTGEAIKEIVHMAGEDDDIDGVTNSLVSSMGDFSVEDDLDLKWE